MFERKKENVEVSLLGHVKHSRLTVMLAVKKIIDDKKTPLKHIFPIKNKIS